ncbi:MAG: threonine synthase, partial [Candidatus Methanomethylicota archaeon]
MGEFALFLECCRCGREFSVDSFAFRCFDCDEPLEVVYDYDLLKSVVSREVFAGRLWGLWRFWELLPVSSWSNVVSLGEGGTPLIRSMRLSRVLGVGELYFKDEGRNPTGSFKDRGSSVGVSVALEVGAGVVGCASTGNMAASLSAYAAKAGLKCVILIPHGTPVEKVLQTLYFEPVTLAVDLPYPELYRMAFEMAGEFNVYLVHSDSPMRVE